MRSDSYFAAQNAYLYMPLYHNVGVFYANTGSILCLSTMSCSMLSHNPLFSLINPLIIIGLL